MDTSVIWAPLYYGQVTWYLREQNPYKVYFSKMDTSIIRTPLYYGQVTWSLREQNTYKVYFSKTDTSIIIGHFSPVPVVSIIKRFDCTPEYLNPI